MNSTNLFYLWRNVGFQTNPSEVDWRAPERIPPDITTRPGRPAESDKPLVTLTDQFTWGSVVCAGVFIVVFVCVMSAWWFHKRRQNIVRERLEHLQRRRQEALSPFQIDNCVRAVNSESMQRPPSYFEVIGANFELPPSYIEAVINKTDNHIYYNTAIVIDEPPPFYEEQKPVEQDHSDPHPEQIDVNNTTCVPATVTIATNHNNSSSNV